MKIDSRLGAWANLLLCSSWRFIWYFLMCSFFLIIFFISLRRAICVCMCCMSCPFPSGTMLEKSAYGFYMLSLGPPFCLSISINKPSQTKCVISMLASDGNGLLGKIHNATGGQGTGWDFLRYLLWAWWRTGQLSWGVHDSGTYLWSSIFSKLCYFGPTTVCQGQHN